MNSNDCMYVDKPIVPGSEYSTNIAIMDVESMEIRQIVDGKDVPLVKLSFEIAAESATDQLHAFITDLFCTFKSKVSDLVFDYAERQGGVQE